MKPPKYGSRLTKYSNNPIEYKYIDKFNKLLQRLYYTYAQEKVPNNNFHNKKWET
jgi:disulfide oxidoreductase YuzD